METAILGMTRLDDTSDRLGEHFAGTPATSRHTAYGKHDHTVPTQGDNHLLGTSHQDSRLHMAYDKYHRPGEERVQK